jgi:iron(III) transport system permease protein
VGGLLKGKIFTLLLIVSLLLAIGFLPLLVMLIKSITVDGHISFANYKMLFSSSREWTLLVNSCILSLLTTLFATAIGLSLGILFGKSDLPFRHLFSFLFTIPLLVPPYIIAVSWFTVLGRDGFLTGVLNSQVTEFTLPWLFGLPGCILVLSSVFMPIVMLLTMAYLKTINPQLEEAARLSARWPAVLKGITIPSILPGIQLAAILVFLLTLGEFSVPMFLRYDVFPVESFTRFSAFYNFGAATAAAIPLALVTFLILILERVLIRENTYQLQPSPGEEHALSIKLGSYRWLLFSLVSLLLLMTILIPLLVLIIQSASIFTYVEAFSKAAGSLLRSLIYGAVGASVLTILGFFLGYLIHTKAFRFWLAVDSFTIFLFALPGIVIGIGLISLWNRPSTNFIYGTPAIIILGYIAQYVALPSRVAVSTLAQIPTSMDEAAQIAGASWLRCLILILVPLAKRGLIAGWLVGYIFCMRDTGISMIVYPPGYDTLPVRTFTLMANSPTELIAALCVIMIIATLLPLGALGLLFKPGRQAG